MSSEQEIWACAALIERQHGDRAPLFVAEQIGALALDGNWQGVAIWKAVAARLDALHSGQRQGVS